MNQRLKFLNNRWLITVGLFALLTGLITYGYLHNPAGKLRKYLADPLRYDGQQIDVDIEAKVVKLLPDGFIIQELGQMIRVNGNPQTASPGDFIRLRAIFHKEGYLELKQLHVGKRRRSKIFVSIVPVFLVFLLLLRTYRIDWHHLLLEKKADA